jgi:hypothetical protein
VITKNAPATFQNTLEAFEPSIECAFWPRPSTQQGYQYHGVFVLPVHFIGSGTECEIDFVALSPPLRRLRSFLVENDWNNK